MRALVVMLVAARLAVAAPMPFVESRAPEAILETGTAQRAEALKRRLASAEIACKGITAEVREGGKYVVMRLAGEITPERRKKFGLAVASVTRKPDGGEEQMLILRRGRLLIKNVGFVLDQDLGSPEFPEQDMIGTHDLDIRLSPPALVKPAARR